MTRYMRFIATGAVVAFNQALVKNDEFEAFEVEDGVSPHNPLELGDSDVVKPVPAAVKRVGKSAEVVSA